MQASKINLTFAIQVSLILLVLVLHCIFISGNATWYFSNRSQNIRKYKLILYGSKNLSRVWIGSLGYFHAISEIFQVSKMMEILIQYPSKILYPSRYCAEDVSPINSINFGKYILSRL